MHNSPRDDEPELAPIQFAGHVRLPSDAQRLGLDRNTEEGALIAMAGSLNPSKLSHRIVAWVMVLAMTLPLLLTLSHELF